MATGTRQESTTHLFLRIFMLLSPLGEELHSAGKKHWRKEEKRWRQKVIPSTPRTCSFVLLLPCGPKILGFGLSARILIGRVVECVADANLFATKQREPPSLLPCAPKSKPFSTSQCIGSNICLWLSQSSHKSQQPNKTIKQFPQ